MTKTFTKTTFVKSPTLQIAGRAIGTDYPTLVIAEIGVNHDGSPERALELVDAAANAGADAVKLQIFSAANLVNAAAPAAEYQRRFADESPAAMLTRLELSQDAIRAVVARIRERGLIPVATPFSPPDVATIGRLRLPAIKIASPDLINRPLLMAAATLSVPLIISTGAATADEVTKTISWLRKWKADFALLQCTSSYPADESDANLCWLAELAAGGSVPVGFSDHTRSDFAGALAVAAGACIVEKHLTYDRGAVGPDHSASADPAHFAYYVALIRQAEKLRGRPGKRVLDCEADVRQVSRQSLVLARDVESGKALRKADLIVQRPGIGIPANRIDEVIGRRLAVPAAAGTMLTWELLGHAA
jgi:N-acetylneuraminate synthase/N,N'-diacetyllegionaminate synthase